MIKKNGFFKITLGSRPPQKLIMDSSIFYLDWINVKGGMLPIRAADANVYLVSKESSSHFPNYYVTENFRTFHQISYLNPERQYNWTKTELITWKLPDSTSLSGVLYKPSNFNAQKKYPMIINLYETLSNTLNVYNYPTALCNTCEINPSVLASNGYLVFRPDIIYKQDAAGESALNAIESAIMHLSKFTWLDSSRIGIQGCSFGGYETNYIISHSTLFKAACTASGVSDPITRASYASAKYLEFDLGRQHRFSKRPWESPLTFTSNSVLYNIDKISTPLLLMHTTGDTRVPINQAIQLYLLLRETEKDVWLLEYGRNANHGLTEANQQDDFSMRMTQFFDHYLKDKPSPPWMK